MTHKLVSFERYPTMQRGIEFRRDHDYLIGDNPKLCRSARSPTKARGQENGENPAVSASWPRLFGLDDSQKIISRNVAAGRSGDFFCHLARGPAASIAERSDPTASDADRLREIAALDAFGFEVFGQLHGRDV